MARPTQILLLTALAALAGAALWAWVERQLGRWRWARRRRRGRAGEQRAPAVLSAAGYEVLAEQPEQQVLVAVDGEACPVTVRVDFLVARRRDGARFVAEVKTGDKAPRPTSAATRRQLLEYRLVYPVDGALLVDMEAGVVHEVAWPELDLVARSGHPGQPRTFLSGLLAGALLGAALALLLLGRACG